LLIIEKEKIQKYGFTSAKGQKQNLCNALKEIKDIEQALLLGVWTGKYSTHLFALDIKKAIFNLEKV